MVNEVSSKFSKEELINRAFYRIAWNVYHMWEETGDSDSRLFMEPLIPNKFVHAGNSKNGGDIKEHVVPRVMICKECHRMFSNRSSIEDVADFIKKFLKVVHITKEERDTLDLRKNLNLKKTMPTGWSFENGDVYSRLKYAKIEFDLLP